MTAALSYEHNALLYVWNTETSHGASLWTFSSAEAPKTLPGDIVPNTVAFSPDGTLGAGGDMGRVFIWDLKTNKLQRTLLGAAEELWTVKFSQDGRLLLTDGFRFNLEKKEYDQSLRVWRILIGNGPQRPGAGERPFDISPDSRWLAYSTQNSGLNIADTNVLKGRPLLPQKGPGGTVAFNRTGTRFAFSNSNSGDVEIRSLTGPKFPCRLRGHTHQLEELAFSPQEDILASASDDGLVGLWSANASNCSLIRFLGDRSDPSKAVWSVSFHPDGRILASAGNDGLIHLWRVPSGEQVAQLGDHTGSILDVSFSPDGNRLASAGADGTVRLWDVRERRQLRVIEEHEWSVRSVAWHPSGKYFVTGSWDGTGRLWTREGNALATITTFSNSDDWLVVAPDGLFDGSAQGIQRAMWRVGQGNEVLPLAAFFLDFYHPGLLAELFADDHPKARVDLAMALQFPGLRLLLASNHATFRQIQGNNYVVCLNELPGVAVNIAAGDSAIPMEHDGFRITRDATCPFQRLLPGTPDQQRSYVSGMQAAASRVATPWDNEMATDTRQARLHVFTVGVTEYRKDSGFDRLTYAGASAQAIERYFRGAPSRRLPFAAVKVWPGLYDKKATKSGIVAALRALAADAKDEDVVLLYFAGHGEVEIGQEMFYFVPSDGNGSRLAETGFSAADIADVLRGLPSHRVVLIVDACQAGASMEALEDAANAKAQAELRILRQEPATTANSHRVGVHLLAATMPLSFAVQIKTDRSALAATLLDYFDRAPNGITAKGVLAHTAAALPRASRSLVGFEQIPLTVTIGQDFPLVNR
jgi:WD40 repeat protein